VIREAATRRITWRCPFIEAKGQLKAHKVRKPALDLSDIVRQPCTVITEASQ